MQEQRIKAVLIRQWTPGRRIPKKLMGSFFFLTSQNQLTWMVLVVSCNWVVLVLSRRTFGGKEHRMSLIYFPLMAVLLGWVKASKCWRGFRKEENFGKIAKPWVTPFTKPPEQSWRSSWSQFADVGSEVNTRGLFWFFFPVVDHCTVEAEFGGSQMGKRLQGVSLIRN